MEKLRLKIVRVLLISTLVFGFGSCTKYNYLDGGKALGIHNCSMWDYMVSDSYNWDSTRVMVERAGLKELLQGKTSTQQITFFAPTNLTILRHILRHNEKVTQSGEGEMWKSVMDIPVEECQKYLKRLIVPSRHLRDGIPGGKRDTKIVLGEQTYVYTGGKKYAALQGELFIYTFSEPYNEVPEAGPKRIYLLYADNLQKNQVAIASSDIQTNNGVVHSLPYTFNFNDL